MKNKNHQSPKGSEAHLGFQMRSRYRGHGKHRFQFTPEEQKELRDVEWIRQHGTRSQKNALIREANMKKNAEEDRLLKAAMATDEKVAK